MCQPSMVVDYSLSIEASLLIIFSFSLISFFFISRCRALKDAKGSPTFSIALQQSILTQNFQNLFFFFLSKKPFFFLFFLAFFFPFSLDAKPSVTPRTSSPHAFNSPSTKSTYPRFFQNPIFPLLKMPIFLIFFFSSLTFLFSFPFSYGITHYQPWNLIPFISSFGTEVGSCPS